MGKLSRCEMPGSTSRTIHSIARNRYHDPWRATAFEIHSVVKIERIDGTTPQLESRCLPSEVTPGPTPLRQGVPPVPRTTPQAYATILHAIKIKIPYGETILTRGMRLPIISRDEQRVTVQSMGGNYAIPISATDVRYSRRANNAQY